MELFVGNLAESVTPTDLKRFFAGYGQCVGFLLVNRVIDGQVNRCAYGVIEPENEGRRALRELNHRDLHGRAIVLTEHVSPERRRPRRMPWGGKERRHRKKPALIEPVIAEDRRRSERRQTERRASERRVADRRSPVQPAFPSPMGEARFNDHRVAQRRVGERRGAERRHSERRHAEPVKGDDGGG